MARLSVLSTQSSVLPSIARSPVAEAEARYQRSGQRATPRRAQGWRKWVMRLLYLAALLPALIIFWGEFAGAVLWRDTSRFTADLGVWFIYLLTFTLVEHIMMLLRTIAAGANSISRERQAGTWDLLLLTGIDSRRLILGKWWGTLRAVAKAYLPLIPLRAGIVLWIASTFSDPFFYFASSGAYMAPPNPLGILLVLPVIALFTYLGAALAAAVGVLASALVPRPALALATGVAAYIVTVILGTVALSLLHSRGYYISLGASPATYDVVGVALQALDYVRLTVIDNGYTLALGFASYTTEYHPPGPGNDYLSERVHDSLSHAIALVFSVLMHSSVILVMLRVGRWFAVRSGALKNTE